MVGSAFTLHLALADIANDVYEWRVFAGDKVLADKCRISRRALTRAKAILIEEGLLEVISGNGNRKKMAEYRLVFPDATNSKDGDNLGKPVDNFEKTCANLATVPTAESETCANLSKTCANLATVPEPIPSLVNLTKLTKELTSSSDEEEPSAVDCAKQILNDYWEECQRKGLPVPSNYIAAVKVLERLILAGWSEDRLAQAVREAPTISGGALEFALRKSHVPSRQGAADRLAARLLGGHHDR